jgi:hypothetical protein
VITIDARSTHPSMLGILKAENLLNKKYNYDLTYCDERLEHTISVVTRNLKVSESMGFSIDHMMTYKKAGTSLVGTSFLAELHSVSSGYLYRQSQVGNSSIKNGGFRVLFSISELAAAVHNLKAQHTDTNNYTLEMRICIAAFMNHILSFDELSGYHAYQHLGLYGEYSKIKDVYDFNSLDGYLDVYMLYRNKHQAVLNLFGYFDGQEDFKLPAELVVKNVDSAAPKKVKDAAPKKEVLVHKLTENEIIAIGVVNHLLGTGKAATVVQDNRLVIIPASYIAGKKVKIKVKRAQCHKRLLMSLEQSL